MAGAQKPVYVSALQERIARVAAERPELGFTSLAHLIDIDWLREAYNRTRKAGAAGVDGQTGKDYEANLQINLQSLLDRAKSGTYVAPPVRRAYIPKAGSSCERRALGIPTFEDKVLQRAVTMVLETIYEQDFYPCSYGFRPGRSAHQARRDLWQQTMQSAGGWILEVDIRKFLDTLDHAQLRRLLEYRQTRIDRGRCLQRDGVDHQLGAGLVHRVPESRLRCFWRLPCAHVVLHEAGLRVSFILEERPIDRRFEFPAHRPVFGIPHHADDLDVELRVGATAPRHQLSQRVLGLAEVLARQLRIDYGHFRLAGSVLVSKHSARHQRDIHRREITWRDR